MANFQHGTEVRYCHEGNDRRAQVSTVDPQTGEVLGLAVYDDNGNIECGVTAPKLATEPTHRVTNGYFWSR